MDEGRPVEEGVAGEIPATDRQKGPHGGCQGTPLRPAEPTVKLPGQSHDQRRSRRELGEGRQPTDDAQPQPLLPRRRRTGRDAELGGAPG